MAIPDREDSQGHPDRPILLVVDDNRAAHTQAQLAMRKTRTPVTVISAFNGIEAVDLLKAHGDEIRVVLLDVWMPSIDGRWLALEVRRLAPSAQVVPFTTDPAAGRLMQRFGATEPVAKVITAQDLADRIDHVLTLPPPQIIDSELADFFRDQIPRQLRMALEHPPNVRAIALIGRNHTKIALDMCLPRAGGELVAASMQPDELRRISHQARLDLLITTPDLLPTAQLLAHDLRLPVIVCANPQQVAGLPGDVSIVVDLADTLALATALIVVADGGLSRPPRQQSELEAHWPALTPREQDVVRLVAAGDAVPEMALRMGISGDRIRHLLTSIYRKLPLLDCNLAGLREWLQKVGPPPDA